MNKKLLRELADQLRRRRSALLEGVAGSQQAATAIIQEREAEIEENAQKDRIARLTSRLTERDRRTIQEIDAALERMEQGTYGQCAWCENDIKPERLRALPTAVLCIDCATAREKRQRALAESGFSERPLGSDRDLDADLELPETQD
jgi:DnaK suppressor protein